MVLPCMRADKDGKADRRQTRTRALDARALTKEAGALENSAWNTS